MVGSALQKRVSAWLLAVSLFSTGGFSADSPQWSVQHWTTEHGLPQNTVLALAQSKRWLHMDRHAGRPRPIRWGQLQNFHEGVVCDGARRGRRAPALRG